MKTPRDIKPVELINALSSLGYSESRRTGSHIRLTTQMNGEHHITIVSHGSLRIGTLHSILKEIANHFGISVEDLKEKLFSR